MREYLCALFLMLAASLSSGVMRVAAEPVNSDYFPLAVGNRWVYESSEGSEEAPALETWEVVRQEGNSFVVRIQQPFVTVGGLEEHFAVDGDGVKHRIPAATPSEPQLILKFPPTAGVRWQSGEGVYVLTTVGETVTTPAGAFANCVVVTRWHKATKITLVSTYAPGVGLVQREETFPVISGLGGDFETPTRGRTVLRLKEWSVKAAK